MMHVDAVSDAYWRRPNKERTVGGWGRSVGVNRVNVCLQMMINSVSDKEEHTMQCFSSSCQAGKTKRHVNSRPEVSAFHSVVFLC